MKKIVFLSLLAAVLASPVAFSPANATTEVKAVELKDGTKAQIEGDSVYVLDAKGEKKPAPDGTHEAKDGSKITTKEGKIVK